MSFELPPDPRVGTVLAERYRIDAVLGEGAMGKVYAAEHVLMRKRLAVKVLHRELSSVPELVARFEREAMAAANIDHPNVASATDFGKLEDGAVFLALELVEGRCLRDEIAKGPMPVLRALHIARQVAAALGSAHALNIVHRDLKPENVMLVERGGDPDFVKVLDFGVARVPIGDASSDGGGPITRAGMVFGTPEYIPPEQALGQVSDGRADLYSLGVMLFELLTGSRPFVADSKVSLVGQHLGKTPPRLAERAKGIVVPEPVEALVMRLLEKEAARRPQNAEEVVKALDKLIGKPTHGPLRLPRRTREPRGIAARLGAGWKAAKGSLRRGARASVDWVEEHRDVLPARVADRLKKVSSRTLAMALGGVAALVSGLLLFALAAAFGGKPATPEKTALPAVASTPYPPAGTASAVAKERDPEPALLEAARVQGVATLEPLEKQYPESPALQLELGRARLQAKDYAGAVKAVARALALDPSVKNDGRAATVLFQAAQIKDTIPVAFELLEGPMEERGAAIGHDLAVFAAKGSAARARADAFLDSPRFEAVAAPPVRLARRMRRARVCSEVRELLPEVKRLGDKHSLHYLKFFQKQLVHYPCLKKDTLLDDATKAVEERMRAGARP